MTGRCEPVSGGVGEWHWLQRVGHQPLPVRLDLWGWRLVGGWLTREQAHYMGYQYLEPCRPPRDPTNDELEALWLRVGGNHFAYGRALLKGDY